MVKTRRKTKATAAAEAAAHDQHDAGSQDGDAAVLVLDIPDDIDLDSLSNLLPDASFTHLTADTALALYKLVLSQASRIDEQQRELEETRADSQRKDVELDQALQDKENVTAELQNSFDSARDELVKVRQERDQLADSQKALEAKVATLSTSQSSSTTELDALRHQVDARDREKRELIGVIDRLKQGSAQTEVDTRSLRNDLRRTRQEKTELEDKVRELRSSEISTRFKIETLDQQLKLADSTGQRVAAELSEKIEEFGHFRRIKNAELADLQIRFDALSTEHMATESQLNTLQASYSSQTRKFEECIVAKSELENRLTQQRLDFESEALLLKQLVADMEKRDAFNKAKVDELENDYEKVLRCAEARETELEEQLEKEQARAEEAEAKLKTIEEGLKSAQPAQEQIDDPDAFQGMQDLSPTVELVARFQRGGKTFTDVFAENTVLKKQLREKQNDYDQLKKAMDAVLNEVGARAPMLAKQREAYASLLAEAESNYAQLSAALAERDRCSRMVQEEKNKCERAMRENEQLQEQLADLGRQVRELLRQEARLTNPHITDDMEVDSRAEPARDFNEVITDNLILFRNINGLQEQNQRLIKVVREMGAKMEAEEKEYKATMQKEQLEAIKEAHLAIRSLELRLKNQEKTSEVTIQAKLREIDALRDMLKRRELDVPTSGTQSEGDASAQRDGDATDRGDVDESDAAKRLSQVQQEFDAFKRNMGADASKLSADLYNKSREVMQLTTELTRAQAQIGYLNEHQQLLEDQRNAMDNSLRQMTERNRGLYEQFARLDTQNRHLMEELMDANQKVERLRHECSNLRAEKRIFEGMQERLEEQTKTLERERSQMTDRFVDMQRMQNNLEQFISTDKLQLQTQVQNLEVQNGELRSQLSQERDAVRHLTLQRDEERREHQQRLNRTVEDLRKTSSAHSAAETSNKHLQEQIEDLARRLKGYEEKLSFYERRTSGANGAAQSSDSFSREQELEAEIAQLRTIMKNTEEDLARTRESAEQFQDISRANEEALASLTSTHEEYKADSEARLAKAQADKDSLNEELHALQQQLVQASEKYSELQKTFEKERAAWINDKKTLEDTIVDMTTSGQNVQDDRVQWERQVQEQANRAKAAEERYSREVIAHADAIKLVADLRSRLENTEAAAREGMAAAETARANLSRSEESWKGQRDQFEREIAALGARCRDLTEQNNILHGHLESVSTQASRIKEAINVPAHASGEETDDNTDAKLADLRSLVAYLRREKDIVELQLEVSKKENTRSKLEIERLTRGLNETQKLLAEERERAAEAATSLDEQNDLLEKIKQLRVLSESNNTLRADCDAHQQRARELTEQLERLSAELEPAKEEARRARMELQARDVTIRQLEEENRRWQERNAQLLTKYDRIDPAEVQSLKDAVSRLEAQNAELEQNKSQELEGTLKKFEVVNNECEKLKAMVKENNTRARNTINRLKDNVSSLEQEVKTLTEERDALKAAGVADAAPAELEALRTEKANLESALNAERANLARLNEQAAEAIILREERDRLLAEKASSNGQSAVSEDEKRRWEADKAELIQARQALQEETTRNKDEIRNLKAANDKFQTKIREMMQARAADSQKASAAQEAAVAAAIEKVKSDLSSIDASAMEEAAKRHAQELASVEQRLRARHEEQLRLAVEAARAEGGRSNQDLDAAVAAAIAAHEVRVSAEKLQEATENGRQELAMKTKLVSGQLMKAQARLKEIEGRIRELGQAGKFSEEEVTNLLKPTPPGANAASSATSGAPPPESAAAAAPSPAPVPSSPSTSSGPNVSAGAVAPSPPSGGRGRGRGRGGPSAAAGQRQNSTGAASASNGASAMSPPPSADIGMSIMGAAAKRAREDAEEPATPDTLAKRLRSGNQPGGRPVTLRRDRVPPPV